MKPQTLFRTSDRRQRGFTLMELIVVVSLISIVMVFSIPRLQGSLLSDQTGHALRWMTGTIQNLKAKALLEQKAYFLVIDMDHGRLSVSDTPVDGEMGSEQIPDGYQLPSGVRLLDVSFPFREKATAGITAIRFFDQGYSEKALIHVEIDAKRVRSLQVEPFLDQVEILDGYVEFPDASQNR